MKSTGKNVAGIVIYAVLYIAIIYGSLCLGYLHPFFWVMHCVIFGGIYSIWFGATCILIFTTYHSRRGGFGCSMLYLEAEKRSAKRLDIENYDRRNPVAHLIKSMRCRIRIDRANPCFCKENRGNRLILRCAAATNEPLHRLGFERMQKLDNR